MLLGKFIKVTLGSDFDILTFDIKTPNYLIVSQVQHQCDGRVQQELGVVGLQPHSDHSGGGAAQTRHPIHRHRQCDLGQTLVDHASRRIRELPVWRLAWSVARSDCQGSPLPDQ